MSLFEFIAKAQLEEQVKQGLDARKIIRIEKQLNAMVKLDKAFQPNEAIQLVEALKSHANEIAFVLDNTDFHQLLLLKNNPNDEWINESNSEPGRVASFIEEFCLEDLSKIITTGLKRNYFSLFKTFYKYRDYLPHSINERITSKLNEKLRNKITYLNQKKESPDNAIYKESFYKTLNIYKNLETDELVGDLLDSTMYCFGDKVKGKTKHVINGMTHYEPLDEELAEVIISNGELAKPTWNARSIIVSFFVIFTINIFVSIFGDDESYKSPKLQYMLLRTSDLPETICNIGPATKYLLSYAESYDSSKHAYIPSKVKFLHYKGKTSDTLDHFIRKIRVSNNTMDDLVFTEFRGNCFRHSVFIPSKQSVLYNLDTSSFFKLYFGKQLYTHDSTKKKINIPIDNIAGMMNSIKFMNLYRFNDLSSYNRETFRNAFKFYDDVSISIVNGRYKIKSLSFAIPDHPWMKDSFNAEAVKFKP